MISRKLFFTVITLLPAYSLVFNATILNAATFKEAALKTLFTSPSERHNIDASRRGVSGADFGTLQAGPSSVHVTGIVTRGNNKSVVWVNGKNTMNNNMVDGVKVYPNSMKKNNKIPMRIDGRMVYVKPGETWSEGSGTSDSADR